MDKLKGTMPAPHSGTKRTGLVHFYRIIGTARVVAVVLEPGSLTGTHSSVTTVGGKWYGYLGTRVLPADVEAMPVGKERTAKVDAYHIHQWHYIEKLIDRVMPHPEISDHCKRTDWKYEIGTFGYVWNDQEFADYIAACDAPATYFPVEWTEY